jgi:hypothetical protein
VILIWTPISFAMTLARVVLPRPGGPYSRRWSSGSSRDFAASMKILRRQQIFCSFCGKSQQQVERMIAGPNYVFICIECVELCNQILAAERNPAPA